eukprot:CAMPEP_0206453000 /NCGR_PEP_ID=MMETSP0324_2-20121206/20274_1 /ASSEMBLY_ACC=CAM_ASM_000836 /TAXON_ID=2866 /ORGANISM="Crypthecodinium cohnii, Strain Seligo" /LENGTH=62 /DNA_ID=CAMNT_0053923185 /DNA_START=53 /DNA_END=241 /DNA_ORIENTATION=-
MLEGFLQILSPGKQTNGSKVVFKERSWAPEKQVAKQEEEEEAEEDETNETTGCESEGGSEGL